MELNRRSRAGSLIHFALLLIVVFFSSYFRDHPVTIVAAGAILLGLGIGRLFLSSLFAKRYHEDPIFWKQLFCVVAWAAALTWGGFCCLTMALYGQQWISWLVLLITTGIAADRAAHFRPISPWAAFTWCCSSGQRWAGSYSRAARATIPWRPWCVYTAATYGCRPECNRKPTWDKLIQSRLLSLRTSELEEQDAYLKALIEEVPRPSWS